VHNAPPCRDREPSSGVCDIGAFSREYPDEVTLWVPPASEDDNIRAKLVTDVVTSCREALQSLDEPKLTTA
jgi:hypothetical protein